MTLSTTTEVSRRRSPVRPSTMASAVSAAFGRAASYSCELRWPNPRYQEDPIAFAREILGVELWGKQIEIAKAVRDTLKVAVKSGRRVGKTTLAACIALWFYCSYPDARVILLAPVADLLDKVLYREIRRLWMQAKDRGTPIDGELSILARTGLKAPDLREITGRTANEAEALQGIAGAHLCFLVDEASGVEDRFFEAIDGNRSGGNARLFAIGNPTRTIGTFYDAFHRRSSFWSTFSLSSLESPNVVEGRVVIPGLATREEMEQRRQEYGEDSPYWRIHVLGEFVENEEGRVFSTTLVDEAERRWSSTSDEGRLHIGVDVAGTGEQGDDAAIAIRRGSKILDLHSWRPKSEGDHLAKVLGYITTHRREREQKPIVAIDCENAIGSTVLGLFRAHLERHKDDFELLPVRASARAQRAPKDYERVRDELWARMRGWMEKEGGAIPIDERLRGELTLPEWSGTVNGRQKLTEKDKFRKALGRSPDRADALALAVWEPTSYAAHERELQTETISDEYESPAHFDPYAHLSGAATGETIVRRW